MIITIQRLVDDNVCTIGSITVNTFVGSTLEPPFHAVKIAGKTRIPAGQYVLALRTDGGMNETYRQKFGDWHKGMLWLQDVPGFEDVYIHIGNFPHDTLGCILVGTSSGKDVVNESTMAYRTFYPQVADAILNGEEVIVDVMDEQP